MKTAVILIQFAILLQLFGQGNSSSPVCTNLNNFKHLIEYNTSSSITFLMFKDFGLLRCVQQCLFRTRCQSINFDITTNICELNQENSADLKFRKGIIFTEIKKWPKRLALLCENHRCENGTVCTINGKTTNCSTDPSPLDIGYTKSPNLSLFYKLHSENRTFEEARRTCLKEGAQLIEIKTAEKNNFLKGVMRAADSYAGMMIGASDIIKEGEWRWNSSGERLSYTDWSENEPNNFRNNEDCAAVWKSLKLKWNDFDCKYKLTFICEIS